MPHGGQREGSGRKRKFNAPTRLKRVPTGIPDAAIDGWLKILETVEQGGFTLSEMSIAEISEAYRKITESLN